jgi:hypothetical protein
MEELRSGKGTVPQPQAKQHPPRRTRGKGRWIKGFGPRKGGGEEKQPFTLLLFLV